MSKRAASLSHKETAAPKSRAERRAAARASQRELARVRAARQGTLSSPTIIAGVASVLIIAGVIVYALIGANRSAGTADVKGLTDPNAYAPAPQMLKVGAVAPDFTMKTYVGRRFHLAAQHGHPVVLEFYAVWCPVCHAEAPTMARLASNYQALGVPVWGVLSSPYGQNYDDSNRTDLTPATASDVAWYAQTYHIQFPLLSEPNYATVNQYGVSAYPGIYIIGKDGKVRWATTGFKSYGELSRALNQALAAPAR